MLTLGQQRTLEFIKKFFSEYGYAPTAAEIAQGTGIKSRGVVHRYLKALAVAHKIQLIPRRHRNISLVDEAPMHFNALPLLGAIVAGRPIEVIHNAQPIDLSKIFLGAKRYGLSVQDDSMKEEGIFNGDVVVCEHATTAHNGQIVVAVIDESIVTLKRLEKTALGKVILHPANCDLKPLVFDDAKRVTIQGIFVGLLRAHHEIGRE